MADLLIGFTPFALVGFIDIYSFTYNHTYTYTFIYIYMYMYIVIVIYVYIARADHGRFTHRIHAVCAGRIYRYIFIYL